MRAPAAVPLSEDALVGMLQRGTSTARLWAWEADTRGEAGDVDLLAAALRLCGGDEERAVAAFNRSPRHLAPEWGELSYRERVLDAAVQGAEGSHRADHSGPAPSVGGADSTGETYGFGGWARGYALRDFLDLAIPPRAPLLVHPNGSGILFEKDLALLYGWRGTGKSWVAAALAVGLATGEPVLRWMPANPSVPVTLIDGELPGVKLQENLAYFLPRRELGDVPLRIVSADMQDMPLPSLATPEGQRAIAREVEGSRVVIVDNLATLAGTGGENEADSWRPVQSWMLEQRRAGRAVVALHHAGKGGQQRGTSAREDVLDLVVALRRPRDYMKSEGARFELHFEKSRNIGGDAAEPFDARLLTDGGRAEWAMRDVAGRTYEAAVELLSEGCRPESVAAELGCDRATVYRYRRQAVEEGKLAPEPAGRRGKR